MLDSLKNTSDSHCVVDESRSGSTLVLTVSGVLDMLTADELATAVGKALTQRPERLVLDLLGVDFLASHGMSVIVDAYFRAGSDTSVVVVADGPATARPLALVGISDVVAVHATLDSALAESAAA